MPAGSPEIWGLHPTTTMCTRVKTLTGASNKTSAIRFDSVASGGCEVYYSGMVPSELATSFYGAYTANIRLYFSTAALSSKTVAFGVVAYALTDWDDGMSGVEKPLISDFAATELTTGSPRAFIANQIGYVEGPVPVYHVDGTICDSDCDGAELIIHVVGGPSMSSSIGGSVYLLDASVGWAIL